MGLAHTGWWRGIPRRVTQAAAAAAAAATATATGAGREMESSNFPFPLVHVDIAKAIAEACAAEGVQKLIHVSALGASASSKSRYYQTKAAGEEAVKAAFPTASIVRPAVMYGWEDRLFNRMAQASSAFPFLPLVDGGETKYQPVHGASSAPPRATLQSLVRFESGRAT